MNKNVEYEDKVGITPVTMKNPITGQSVAPRSWNHGYPADQIRDQHLVPIQKEDK